MRILLALYFVWQKLKRYELAEFFWAGLLEGPNLKKFSYSLRCWCQTDYDMEGI